MTVDGSSQESQERERNALEDFARLALLLTASAAVRLEVGPYAVKVGGSETERPREVELPGVGRLLLFGGQNPERLEPLIRRIVDRAESQEAHASALALAERANDIANSAARRFESLFEGLPVACYACDLDGNLMEWNRAAEEIWGVRIAAGWGQSAASIIDPDHPDAERDVLARSLAGETVRSEEREVRTGDGSLRWHLVSSFPLRDGGDRVVGAIVARLDITRRKAAQQELADRETRFRAVLEALSEGIMVVDQQGQVVLLNPSADRILRLSDEPIGLKEDFPVETVIGIDGEFVPSDRWPLNIALTEGKPARGVMLGLERPGIAERIWISVNAEPLVRPGDDSPIGAVATFNDVTERVRQDAQVAEYAARLAAYDDSPRLRDSR